MRVEIGRFEVSVRLPQVSRVRLVTTLSLASAFTTLWIGAPAYLPFASVDAKLALAGIAIPFGVGYVSLLLAEWRIRRELLRASLLADRGELDPSAQVGQVLVGAAEIETVPVIFVTPARPGDVIEGEVVR
jgi:hypothetical protein